MIRLGAKGWLALADSQRAVGRRVRVELGYDVHDPFAVRLDFPHEQDAPTWEFARELLNDGLVGGVDSVLGDVEVSRGVDPGEVRIALSSPSGRVLLWLRTARVVRFLNLTYNLVPAGTEADRIDWDTELPALLGGVAGGGW